MNIYWVSTAQKGWSLVWPGFLKAVCFLSSIVLHTRWSLCRLSNEDRLLLTAQVNHTESTLSFQHQCPSMELFLEAICPNCLWNIMTIFFLPPRHSNLRSVVSHLKEKNPRICGFMYFPIQSLLSVPTANASGQTPVSHLDYCLQSCLPQMHPPHSWQSDLFKTKIRPRHSS